MLFKNNGKIFKGINFYMNPSNNLKFFLLNNFELGHLYMFIRIFYKNENNLYNIVLNVYCNCFLLFED